MTAEETELSWGRARLIPVFGLKSQIDKEQRATSALLAVLSAVAEFGHAIVSPLGAPKCRLETFTEASFDMSDGSSVRPDGIIRAARGKRTWTCVVEVKTGDSTLDKAQVETYLDLAKEQEFDCVLTISNEIALIPGEHPVPVDRRKLRRTGLFHLSWSRIRTEAEMQEAHQGVSDPDQAWILREFIRYLDHPNSGVGELSDMGEYWVAARDAVKNRTARSSDTSVVAIAGKWEELVSFAALQLKRKLGVDVVEALSLKERKDLSLRIGNIVSSMVSEGVMGGEISIPDTVGNIIIAADLRAQQIVATTYLGAPRTGRPKTRIAWLTRQLKNAPDDVRIDSHAYHSRDTLSELLGRVRDKPELLMPADDREITSFTVSMIRPMGTKRGRGNRSFIDSVLETLQEFYGQVVQDLREWQSPAPQLKKEEVPAPTDTEVGLTAAPSEDKAAREPTAAREQEPTKEN